MFILLFYVLLVLCLPVSFLWVGVCALVCVCVYLLAGFVDLFVCDFVGFTLVVWWFGTCDSLWLPYCSGFFMCCYNTGNLCF